MPNDASVTGLCMDAAKDAQIKTMSINYGAYIFIRQEISLDDLSSLEESGMKWLSLYGHSRKQKRI